MMLHNLFLSIKDKPVDYKLHNKRWKGKNLRIDYWIKNIPVLVVDSCESADLVWPAGLFSHRAVEITDKNTWRHKYSRLTHKQIINFS